MKKLEFWEFYIDDGFNYGVVRGRYSSLEELKKNIVKSEHLRARLNDHYYMSSQVIHRVFAKDSKICLEVLEEKDRHIKVKMWVENGRIDVYKEIITPEVKEPGLPYEPEKREEKFFETIPFGGDTYYLEMLVEKRVIKFDGVPVPFGDMEE